MKLEQEVKLFGVLGSIEGIVESYCRDVRDGYASKNDYLEKIKSKLKELEVIDFE